MGFFSSLARKCKKACKNAMSAVAETVAAPLVRQVTKKIVRRINEASRAITYSVISIPTHVVPAAQAITVPIIVVSSPVIRKGTAIVDKIHSWMFRKIAKPLYKRAALPILRHLRPSFFHKVIAPAMSKVARALDRAIARPFANGIVHAQPITRDIFGLAAQNIMARVARDMGQSAEPGKSALKKERGNPDVEEVLDPSGIHLEAPVEPPLAKEVRFEPPVAEEPSPQDLVQLIIERFGVTPESRMGNILTDFILSSGGGNDAASFALLCRRCQNHRFHTGSRPSDALPPARRTVHELLESIRAGCHMCSSIFEALALPTDGSSLQEQITVETWVAPGQQDSGLGFVGRVRVKSESKEAYLSFMSHVPPGDDSVADLMKAYLSPGTDPSVSLDYLSTWQRICKETHDHCDNRLIEDPKSTRFKFKTPFRLVDIIDEKIEENPDETREYVALSYTWGDISPESKKLQKPTLKNNIESRKHTQGLATVLGSETLPAVYKDAIQVVKRLGYRYLWVDVWCNIQDDTSDLEAQIANMGNVFQNADLTIGAGAGRAKSSSLFSHQQPPAQPFLINTTINNQPHPVIISRQPPPSPSILDTRLWTFQEQLLSRRTVEFGPAYTTWRCSQETTTSLPVAAPSHQTPEHDHDDDNPLEITPTTSKLHSWIRTTAAAAAAQPLVDSRPKFDLTFATAWYSAVTNYTQRSWSVRQDQIPALLGVASSVARHTSWHHLAGLWKEDMPYGLAWYRNKLPARQGHSLSSMAAHEPDCAPSWSWAARANGPVSFWPRGEIQHSLVKFVRSGWVWPEKREVQRRVVLAGEVVEGRCGGVMRDEDFDDGWVGGNVTGVEVEGVRVGYAMLDAPMDLKEVSILPLFSLRAGAEGGEGVWGLGMALTRVISGSSCWYKREGLVVLARKVGTGWDYEEFDEDDDVHKIILA
ncbi:putative HET domain-containing protein [Cercophora samala]|uniref:HET domain-containing protein n=1 Tax=Cercophora samala TaxID=330535 RepID=A0AA39YMH7_9PEZI|nr:putative HET domain-containing protein [Cercophora samala]